MSSDYMEMLRAAAQRATHIRSGITAQDAVSETAIDDALFADYAFLECGREGIAAFRIEALLCSHRKKEFTARDLAHLQQVLWARISSQELPVVAADIAVACLAGFEEAQKKKLVWKLFTRLKGESEDQLIAYSGYLVPILGVEYLYDFEHSTVYGESGGMGGPMRYYLRDFALERISTHLGITPRLIDCFDGRASYFSWIDVPRKELNAEGSTARSC